MSVSVELGSPGIQPAGRIYPQLRTWPSTVQTDALCQQRKSFSVIRSLRRRAVELIVNLKTAKALGVTVPLSLLERADQIFK